ncbi:ribosome silencing factor [Terrihabitans rhizophilus]|uniref:Ribosomal silencing factor RsfS n=1 Tax=Terrihabitans rhizophilus TaxID=3092662 RepID=A0ABU4RPM2_9HYPH|nr:ribosome silencing factor [Terrihabitans sp. PJ23]MDX6806133.1 ribosome silencing factor [Terrihabitans sp. PJ23]
MNLPPIGAPATAPGTDGLDALVIALLEDAKAENTVSINLRGKTSIADTMVVTEGRSARHVASIADRLIQGLKEAGFGRCRVEGLNMADWVLIDAGDAIIHIFRPEVRSFYNLEKMWSADRPDEKSMI